MTKQDAQKVLALLERVTPRDAQVEACIAIVRRHLAVFIAARGQLKDNYETEYGYW